MKLIIDITEDVYTRLFDNGIQDNEIVVDDVCEMARAIRKGIPLEDIKAEIENMSILSSVDIKTGKTIYEGLCRHSDVLAIIDKHIGGE